jgi:malate dehydrogenase (oxaloacetate-decarboxylating)
MVDRFGLLTDDMPNLLDFQQKLVTPREAIAHWDVEQNNISCWMWCVTPTRR